MVDIAELRVFAPGASPKILAGVAGSWSYAEGAGITTPRRVCHFLAQLAKESDGFRTTEEYASGRDYEGRLDLGNTQKGDGTRYKGHGLIQVTGRENHREFTKWLRKRLPDCPDFEASPTKLMEFPWAFLSAVWYWDSRKLNEPADRNDIRAVTLKVNGGYNGLADRRAYFRRATDLWGDLQVNPKGSSFQGTRAVRGGAVSLLGGLSLAGVTEQASQTASLAGSVRAVSDMTGLPLWGLVLGVCLAAGIIYLLWDRRFIYQHEGL